MAPGFKNGVINKISKLWESILEFVGDQQSWKSSADGDHTHLTRGIGIF